MHFFIWFFFLVYSVSILAIDPINPEPQGGVMDLRESVLDKGSLFNLNGEWEFYWEEFLSPQDYSRSTNTGEGIMVKIPSYFNSYLMDGGFLSGMGFGTYALTILLPENNQSTLCFDIPIFDVAFNFFINDKLIESKGTVGTSKEEEEPWYEPSSFCYVPPSDTLQLLIQVSNFHHRRGGFWKSISMGGTERIRKQIELNRIYNYSTIGVLFFFTLFFFIFWFFSRKENLMLVFALSTFGILVLSANTGLYLSNSFFVTDWEWQIRMEYLGSYIALIFGVMFLHEFFPTRYMNQVVKTNTILFSIASISLFILPVHLFAYEMLIFQPVVLLFLLHYLVKSLIGFFKGRVMDAIFFVSLTLFILTLVNDILIANSAGAIHNNYLAPISFQLFIFAMSTLIIIQWVQNYNERVQLESSLRFKNKVLSVIAHDLKNPVASVAQFSDLLTTKPALLDKKNIVDALKESSQAAVTLLDNLLYWGRSQTDELKVSPIEFEIDILINEVTSLYLHMATQKNIKLITKFPSKMNAYADRSLINIVVRNLVSNALKFTPREGSVTILSQKEEKLVRITVEDSGVGIDPDLLEQFKAQKRLGTTSGTESEIGTGLGLQLVEDLVEKNGGTLKIESKSNEGSKFSFTLPTLT